MLQELGHEARQASMSRLKQLNEQKKSRALLRMASSKLQDDLKHIGESADPEWSYLLGTVQDKRHFYEAALNKIEKDAEGELAYVNARKQPGFVKPPDRINESSRFPDVKSNVYERMQEKLEKSKAPTDLDILLQN